MEFTKFLLLTNQQKETVVFRNGTFLTNYEKEKTSCDIYKLFDFYVALYYKLPKNQPATITGHYYSSGLPLNEKLEEIATSIFDHGKDKSVMPIERFNLLDDDEKEKTVYQKGIFIINYEEGNDICDVYKLFDFYVTSCYERTGKGAVKMTTFLCPESFLCQKVKDFS